MITCKNCLDELFIADYDEESNVVIWSHLGSLTKCDDPSPELEFVVYPGKLISSKPRKDKVPMIIISAPYRATDLNFNFLECKITCEECGWKEKAFKHDAVNRAKDHNDRDHRINPLKIYGEVA